MVASGVLVHLQVKENSTKFIVNIIVNIFNIIGNNPCWMKLWFMVVLSSSDIEKISLNKKP